MKRGDNVKNMTLVLVLILIAGVIGISGCTTQSTDTKDNLKIINSTLTFEGDGLYHITGYMKNEGTTKYSFVQLEGKIYNKDGVVLYSDISNTMNLAPGETWQFSIPAFSDKEKPSNYAVAIDKAE